MTSAKKKRPPLVAVCGRPNVGKSTLFNRIIGKQRAIVHDEEGITRDRFFGNGSWNGKPFRVVDTGGIIEDPLDEISKKMQDQVRLALEEATVVVFVLDGQAEITRVDRLVAEELQRLGKPVVLAVNKLDNHKLAMNSYGFYELGLGDPFALSATHNLGVEPMMDAVAAHLPDPPADAPAPEDGGEDEAEAAEDRAPDAPVRVAVVGRPNVGKSSFVNALLNEERAIVSSVPGTTRDAIDAELHHQGRDYVLIDTAGLRKKAGIRASVEKFSVARTLRAMRRSDVSLIMVEATEGLGEQDKRIIGYGLENGVPMVLVWTKWDLVENKEKRFKALADDVDLKMPQIKFIPWVTISNVTRQRVFGVFDHVNEVAEAARRRVPTGELNRLVEQIKAKQNPPSQKGKHAKILYATQTGTRPTTFVFFVNQVRLFHFSYVRFIENQLREAYGFKGVPIKLELREEKPK
ncbi:MAG TPA: ribosome biogenesis GTPase Der [Candidatus Hydrogenedentes bacterium]|nr:ribosome biogenesis GTPase Der [Candidatus Hydrogenedentota bacterium]